MSVSNSKHELQVSSLCNSFCNPEWRSLIGKAVVIVKLLVDKGRELNEGKGEREKRNKEELDSQVQKGRGCLGLQDKEKTRIFNISATRAD